jgi:hypothetical protein
LIRSGVTTPEEVLRVTKAQAAIDGAEKKPAEALSSSQPQAAENAHAHVSI